MISLIGGVALFVAGALFMLVVILICSSEK